MPVLHDIKCAECGYTEERSVDVNTVLVCPNCDNGVLRVVFMKAPMGRAGGDGSDRSIASMRKSFNERFVKKELTDLRHKFGSVIDDSILGGGIQKVKKHESEKE